MNKHLTIYYADGKLFPGYIIVTDRVQSGRW